MFLQAMGSLVQPASSGPTDNIYAWGYQFMATNPTCSVFLLYCNAGSPGTGLLTTLFSNPSLDAPTGGVQLGFYPGYLYGRGSPLAVASSQNVCEITRIVQAACGGAVLGSAPTPRIPTPRPTATPAAGPAAAGRAEPLANTGVADTPTLIGLGLLAIVVGMAMTAWGSERRRPRRRG